MPVRHGVKEPEELALKNEVKMCPWLARSLRACQGADHAVLLWAQIPSKGIVASINLLGSTDRLAFEAFVIRKLVPNLWEGATVVWDNSSIPKALIFMALIIHKTNFRHSG